jgi:signal recognition particle receptor subunit beta
VTVDRFTFKVVVAGPFAAGKTTFIKHISDSVVVGTEAPTSRHEAGVKETTTVGMEHGRFSLVDEDLHVDLLLNGVPGQERFRFMWDIVGEGMDALLLLVDGTDPSTWPAAAAIGHHLLSHGPGPVLVAVNRADQAGPGVVDQVRAALDLPGAGYRGCDILDGGSARSVLVELLVRLLADLEDDGPSPDGAGLVAQEEAS